LQVDESVLRVAAGQHGIVTREQLERLGFSRTTVDWWVRRGRLHRVHRGVYLLGHPVAPRFALGLAAVLACGQGAVMSHRSACVLWELIRGGDEPIDVTVAGNRRKRPGIQVHRAALAPRDTTKRHRIPVTTAARTLLDFAEQATSRELERAFYEALAQRRTSLHQLRKLLDHSDGRRGAPLLSVLLEQYGTPTVTRHEAENILYALIRKGKLPRPERNVYVGRHELDFFWREEGLNAEVDGYQWHRYRNERDQVRDAELEAKRIRVMRISWRILTTEPEAVLVRLAQALTVGGSAPRSVAARSA
jgi:very-short-patch-repair endonuclease